MIKKIIGSENTDKYGEEEKKMTENIYTSNNIKAKVNTFFAYEVKLLHFYIE